MQLIGSAYFQAIGKALPALFLTMTKQGFFLIPFVLILPQFFGLDGIWYAFPVSDILAATVTFLYLRREIRKRLDPMLVEEKAVVERVEV
jgi:Na+-driven multidrug efflux pump